MNTQFIIKFTIKDEAIEAFSKIMRETQSNLPQVTGCIDVMIFHSIETPAHYLLVETWSSKDAHEQHIKRLIDTGVWNDISNHFATDPIGEYYQLI